VQSVGCPSHPHHISHKFSYGGMDDGGDLDVSGRPGHHHRHPHHHHPPNSTVKSSQISSGPGPESEEDDDDAPGPPKHQGGHS
jgi:Ni,Fe-hydrogenase I small subunit